MSQFNKDFLLQMMQPLQVQQKLGEVISITNSEIRVYDRKNEHIQEQVQYTATLVTTLFSRKEYVAFANGDIHWFLFDENESPITGSLSVTIDDVLITNPTSDISLNGSFAIMILV